MTRITIAVDAHKGEQHPDKAVREACAVARDLAATLGDVEVTVQDGARSVLTVSPAQDEALAVLLKDHGLPLLAEAVANDGIGDEIRRFQRFCGSTHEIGRKLDEILRRRSNVGSVVRGNLYALSNSDVKRALSEEERAFLREIAELGEARSD